jgi:hypothetical protein
MVTSNVGTDLIKSKVENKSIQPYQDIKVAAQHNLLSGT